MPQAALADTVSIAQYRERLDSARQALRSARATSVDVLRNTAVGSARRALELVDAVTLPAGGRLVIDDRPLVASLDTTDDGLDAAIARIDARLAMLSRVGAPTVDPAVADARLHEVVQQTRAAAESGDLFDALGRLILRFLSGLRGPGVDLRVLWTLAGGLGVAVILFIVATLGRGLPERVRREVLVRDAEAASRPDPRAHLSAADAALTAGRTREAIHSLYLYVIAALAEREAIRYDPALTDRELLVRAAAIPNAESLRVLVSIYERSWFGVNDPADAEARRARELALRVAP